MREKWETKCWKKIKKREGRRDCYWVLWANNISLPSFSYTLRDKVERTQRARVNHVRSVYACVWDQIAVCVFLSQEDLIMCLSEQQGHRDRLIFTRWHTHTQTQYQAHTAGSYNLQSIHTFTHTDGEKVVFHSNLRSPKNLPFHLRIHPFIPPFNLFYSSIDMSVNASTHPSFHTFIQPDNLVFFKHTRPLKTAFCCWMKGHLLSLKCVSACFRATLIFSFEFI